METTQVLNLTKDQKIDLTKTHPGLTAVRLGMGWDVNTGNSGQFDLDASAILLDTNGKLVGPNGVVYFRNLELPGVKHSGDNRTGAGDGDDESITVTLAALPSNVDRIVFVANIYDAPGVNFGAVKNTHIKVYDGTTGETIANYDPSEDYSAFNSLVFGELYKHNGEWKFKAIGEGKRAGSLQDLINLYQ